MLSHYLLMPIKKANAKEIPVQRQYQFNSILVDAVFADGRKEIKELFDMSFHLRTPQSVLFWKPIDQHIWVHFLFLSYYFNVKNT